MEDLYFNVDELETMSRSDIQALCKKFGIRANLKTDKMKEKLRKYHEEHLNGAKEESKDEDKSEVEESSQIEPSSVSESVAESAAESEVETMDIVPEQKEEESAVEERKEETSVIESEPASEVEEQKSEERSESKMEIESGTVTEAPIEVNQAPVPKIEFPPYEVKTETDPNAPVLLPYSEMQPAAKAPMTPRTKKRVDGIRKNREEKSKNKKIAILGEKRKALEMVVDKISVIKRTTKPTELPKIDDSIDTPKKKSSLTWSEIEASAEANEIPLNEEDIDKFLERKKERIQQQQLISKAPSMLNRGKPIPETFDEFVAHLVKPKEEVKLAPGQTGFEFNPKVEKVVPATPSGTSRGVQSKFGFSAVKSSFTSAASAAVNNAKVSNTAKPSVKTQSKTGVTKTTTAATKASTASNGDYVLGTKNLSNIKEAGSATQAKPRASIATASSRVASTVTKPVVAQSKIDSRRSLLPTSATSTSATKTVTKPVASRPSMITKPVSRQSLVPSRPSTVTKPTNAVSKIASGLPAKSNIVKPITSASLKQQAAAKAAQAESKPAETAAKTETTSEKVEAPKVEAKPEAPKVATTKAAAPRQSLIPKPTTVVSKPAATSTSVTKTSTTATTKPAITKSTSTTAAKAPLAVARPTTKPSIATLIKKRKLEDASASEPAAKKQKVAANNENIENIQNAAVSVPVGVSF